MGAVPSAQACLHLNCFLRGQQPQTSAPVQAAHIGKPCVFTWSALQSCSCDRVLCRW